MKENRSNMQFFTGGVVDRADTETEGEDDDVTTTISISPTPPVEELSQTAAPEEIGSGQGGNSTDSDHVGNFWPLVGPIFGPFSAQLN